jgi:signal transduction histidine kinase
MTMNEKRSKFSERYRAALGKHLKQKPRASGLPALRLGRQAVALGLETLELARIHEDAFATLEASNGKPGLIKRAGMFFNEAILPIEETHRAARQSKRDLHRLNETLSRRTLELAVTNRRLQRDIAAHKRVEADLKKSSAHDAKLLADSLQLQESLRRQTYRTLAAQEDERKKISCELQNEIAQTLLGINVRLLALKRGTRISTKGLKKEIASTQRLVVKSAKSVRRVACEITRESMNA